MAKTSSNQYLPEIPDSLLTSFCLDGQNKILWNYLNLFIFVFRKNSTVHTRQTVQFIPDKQYSYTRQTVQFILDNKNLGMPDKQCSSYQTNNTVYTRQQTHSTVQPLQTVQFIPDKQCSLYWTNSTVYTRQTVQFIPDKQCSLCQTNSAVYTRQQTHSAVQH